MTTVGPVSPSTFTQYALSGSVGAWSDETLVGANDDVTADSPYLGTFGDTSNAIRVSGFDFSAIPSGATIDGIEIAVRCYKISGTSVAILVAATGSGIVSGDDSDWLTAPQGAGAFVPGSLDYISVGASNDTLGYAYTDAEIKSADFFVDFYVARKAAGNGADVGGDHVQVTITSSVAGATTIVVSSASLAYQGKAITVDAKTVKPVVAAAMPYAGRAIAVNAKTAKAVVAGAMHYAGAAVTVNAKTARAVVAGAMAYAGAAVAVNAGKRVAVAAAAMAYAGQATRIAQRIVAGVGQIFYFGQIVGAGGSAAGTAAPGGRRLRLGGGFR